MRKTLLFSLIFVLLLGSGLIGWVHVKHIRSARQAANEAALQLKKQDISVTIPEGWRREQIATLLDSKGICSYEDFLAASSGKEGYLFPDTYRFFPNTTATDVVTVMTTNFTTRTAAEPPTNAQLILASIIEREAKQDSERPLIAGVYQNRLNVGMNLEADPTVQYGRDNNLLASETAAQAVDQKLWNDITQGDYHSVISDYNTYLHNGLPPGPIANPGLESIDAAIHPASHDYLYFLYRNNQLLLSKTLAEQESKE